MASSALRRAMIQVAGERDIGSQTSSIGGTGYSGFFGGISLRWGGIN